MKHAKIGLAHNNNTFVRLSKLQKLSSSLIYARTSKEVAFIIINEGFDALGAICGDVSLYDRENKRVSVLAKKGYPQVVLEKFENSLGKTPLLTMEVLEKQKPFYIRNVDILQKKYSFAQYFIRSTGSKAAVIMPLKTRDTVIGTLQFTFNEVQQFSPQDKQFMLNLADQCAQALDKIIALEKTRQSKEEMDAILKGVDDAVIVRNPEGNISYVNEAAIRLHGSTSAKELLGLSLEGYFALFSKVTDSEGNALSLERVPFAQVSKGKNPLKNVYYKVLKKNNKGYWFKIISLPILNNEGKIERVVSVTHDITEEKENEDSKDEFFGIASHELKTPVTSLKAYTQVLKKRFEKEGSQEVASYLQKMDLQIDKLTNLIHDLLDVTKIEAGRLRFYNELFEFNDLVEDIIEQLQLTTTHTISLKKTKGIVLFGDEERIGQVIINFLTNAIKYSPNSEKIFVRIIKEKGKVIFSVQDFGIGIDEVDQKHIFERFYRERNLKGDTFPGLGLGLYIASEVIKKQHGKIWVESEKGKGSIFFFQLPLAKKENHNAA